MTWRRAVSLHNVPSGGPLAVRGSRGPSTTAWRPSVFLYDVALLGLLARRGHLVYHLDLNPGGYPDGTIWIALYQSSYSASRLYRQMIPHVGRDVQRVPQLQRLEGSSLTESIVEPLFFASSLLA